MSSDIVIVNDFSHINGGAGHVAISGALGLAAAGHRVVLLAAVASATPMLAQAGVRVVATGQLDILSDTNRPRAIVQGIWNTRAAAAMDRILDDLDPDRTVVHVHSWTKALSSSVIRRALARRFKVVCTLHDYFTACPNGGFFDYQRQAICHERPLSYGCVSRNCDARSYAHKLWRVARQEVQRTAGHVPGGLRNFITVSDFSEAILRPFLPADAAVFRVGNPIDVEQRACVDAGAGTRFKYLGRLSPEKGVEMLARAARRLGTPLQFVGDGELKRTLAAAYPEVEITGWLPTARAIDELRSARALVLPSLWYETQGLVATEAAALGIPAIVPDTSAARDAVVDGETGLWFRGGDEDDLARKLERLADAALARRLGRAAYDRYWRSPATIARHVASLETCYRDLQ